MEIEIVVPHNDSRTLRKAFLRSRDLDKAKLVLIENKRNPVGLPVLFNAHKRTSKADWLIFCHQDFIVFESGWLDRVQALEPDACYGPFGLDLLGNLRGRIQQTDGTFLGTAAPYAEVSTLDEMCLIVPRSLWTRLDFDERFPFDFYVSDYCLQAKRLGHPSRIIQLDCQHKSRTLRGDIFSERYLAAKRIFLEKYKDTRPLVTTTFQIWSRYAYPVEKSVTLMTELELIRERKRVLEIGPGGGSMTAALSSRGCRVTAVELDPELAGRVAPFCKRMIVGDIEHLDLARELGAETFDVILLGDVLEHFKDPATLLRKLPKFLEPSGYLVVSIPNVAHASVRLALLHGEFPYQDEGLLDRTHLRFFTLGTIAALFQETGYEIRDLRRARRRFFDVEVPLDPLKVPLALLKALTRDPEASTYQFVFTAIPRAADFDGAGAAPERFRDPDWTPRLERQQLAKSYRKRGYTSLWDNRVREARRLLYRSLILRPSPKTLWYFLAACLPLELLKSTIGSANSSSGRGKSGSRSG